MGPIRGSLERSLLRAGLVDDGGVLLDETFDANVGLARLLADQVDYLIDHDWLNQAGKFDNVSVSQLNRCLVELGLTPVSRRLLQVRSPGAELMAELRRARGR